MARHCACCSRNWNCKILPVDIELDLFLAYGVPVGCLFFRINLAVSVQVYDDTIIGQVGVVRTLVYQPCNVFDPVYLHSST